ncbi:MAG: hypothetical protein JNM29_08565 [Candidatus Odyssella sp.]|nr:hypothetical protein [Candidatus Odyssella sp.]
MAVKPVIFDRNTPPADAGDRAIWEANHALADEVETLVEEFGWGAVVQALLLRFTQQIESADEVATAIEMLEFILDRWRAGDRMHVREQKGN